MENKIINDTEKGDNFAIKVAQLSIKKYKNLGKSGKPTAEEWTVLATIVKEDECNSSLEVVALGTGTKCLGTALWSDQGALVHDSHAEVVTKRCFQLYLLRQIELTIQGNSDSIFVAVSKEENFPGKDSNSSSLNGISNHFPVVKLKKGITFHMYISHSPCGDASIFPTSTADFLESGGLVHNCDQPPSPKRQKTHNDVQDTNRTGAKTVLGESCDPFESGSSYHVTGSLRTKPGRGEPTLSHCCSDKLLRWAILGMQGAIVKTFIAGSPIFISSLIFGKSSFSLEATERALGGRFRGELENLSLPSGFSFNQIKILKCDVEFEASKECQERVAPCPSSLIWCCSMPKPVVSVEGRRHGVTKKILKTEKSQLPICRFQLMKTAINLMKKCGPEDEMKALEWMTYRELKNLSHDYKTSWDLVKNEILRNWTTKPSQFCNFKINIDNA